MGPQRPIDVTSDKRLCSLFLALHGSDTKGRKAVIIRTGVHDPHTTSIEQVFKATHFCSDIWVEEEESLSVVGVVQILDMAGVTAAHGLQMTPAVVKKAMTIWQVGQRYIIPSWKMFFSNYYCSLFSVNLFLAFECDFGLESINFVWKVTVKKTWLYFYFLLLFLLFFWFACHSLNLLGEW